jgi:hypothetical protein
VTCGTLEAPFKQTRNFLALTLFFQDLIPRV